MQTAVRHRAASELAAALELFDEGDSDVYAISKHILVAVYELMREDNARRALGYDRFDGLPLASLFLAVLVFEVALIRFAGPIAAPALDAETVLLRP